MKHWLNKLIGFLDETVAALIRLLVPCAFDPTNMNRIQAGTRALWFYRTATDTAAQAQAANYYDGHAAYMTIGDVIIVSASNEPEILLVSNIAAGVVTTVPLNVV